MLELSLKFSELNLRYRMLPPSLAQEKARPFQVQPSVLSTMMETERKRNRTQDNSFKILSAWHMLLVRVMSIMQNVSALALRLLRHQPDHLNQSSSSGKPRTTRVAPTEGSFELIPPSSPAKSQKSQASSYMGKELITDAILRMVGPPVQCEHGEATRLFICQRQGPNYHKLFWRCAHPRDQQCRTFMWTLIQPYLNTNLIEASEEEMDTETVVSTTTRRSTTSRRSSTASQLLQQAQRHCKHEKVLKSGLQPVQDPGEVCHLWQDHQGGAHRSRHPEGEGTREEPQEEAGAERAHLRGVPGVEEVPGTGTGRGLDRIPSQPLSDPTSTNAEEVVDLKSRGVKQLLRKAGAALTQTEVMWKEIITLLGEGPDRTTQQVFEQYAVEIFDPADPTRIKDKKPLRRLAGLMGVTNKQARVVAEVFNPKRFGPQATGVGLTQGMAFDLTLGHDLLKAKNRQEVRRYVQSVKPGCMLVSSPCTMFSILQNLNQKYREDPQKAC